MKQRRFASIAVKKNTNVAKQVVKMLQGEEVFFTVLFSTGVTFLLVGLAVREASEAQFRNVITNAVPDDDGEISISLGHFAVGATVEVSFTAFSVNKSVNAAALLTYRDTVGQILPKSGTASVKPGVPWAGNGKLLVSAPQASDE